MAQAHPRQLVMEKAMSKQMQYSAKPNISFAPQSVALDTAMDHGAQKVVRILRMKQLIERTGLSRATLYVLMSKDVSFPRKLQLSKRSIGFLESEVDVWISTRAEPRLETQ